MFPTLACLSKASRRPLTSKKANKDFYKGTRQAFLPGGLRTGAPGKHVVRGTAKYRLLDSKVRVFVAPPLEDILSSNLKPYVHRSFRMTQEIRDAQKEGAFSTQSPETFLTVLRANAATTNDVQSS